MVKDIKEIIIVCLLCDVTAPACYNFSDVSAILFETLAFISSKIAIRNIFDFHLCRVKAMFIVVMHIQMS